MKGLPTPQMLHEILRYDRETGFLFWRERPPSMFLHCKHPHRSCAIWNSRYAGGQAGTDFDGYIAVVLKSFGRSRVFAHRIAWAMHYGEWPQDCIDHVNRDRKDNRIGNLRVVSRAENMRNLPLAVNNTTGAVGVSWDRARMRWRAQIGYGRRQVSLGRYGTLEEAITARKAAERALGFHENHGRNI